MWSCEKDFEQYTEGSVEEPVGKEWKGKWHLLIIYQYIYSSYSYKASHELGYFGGNRDRFSPKLKRNYCKQKSGRISIEKGLEAQQLWQVQHRNNWRAIRILLLGQQPHQALLLSTQEFKPQLPSLGHTHTPRGPKQGRRPGFTPPPRHQAVLERSFLWKSEGRKEGTKIPPCLYRHKLNFL